MLGLLFIEMFKYKSEEISWASAFDFDFFNGG